MILSNPLTCASVKLICITILVFPDEEVKKSRGGFWREPASMSSILPSTPTRAITIFPHFDIILSSVITAPPSPDDTEVQSLINTTPQRQGRPRGQPIEPSPRSPNHSTSTSPLSSSLLRLTLRGNAISGFSAHPRSPKAPTIRTTTTNISTPNQLLSKV